MGARGGGQMLFLQVNTAMKMPASHKSRIVVTFFSNVGFFFFGVCRSLPRFTMGVAPSMITPVPPYCFIKKKKEPHIMLMMCFIFTSVKGRKKNVC